MRFAEACRHRDFIRQRLALALGAAIGIALSSFAFHSERIDEESRIRSSFERAAANRVTALQVALAHIEDDIGALGALLATPLWMTPRRLRGRGLGAAREAPEESRALAWVPRVPAAARELIERAGRAEGFESYQITERGALGELQRATARAESRPSRS